MLFIYFFDRHGLLDTDKYKTSSMDKEVLEKKKAYKNDPVYLVTFTCSKGELALLIKLS